MGLWQILALIGSPLAGAAPAPAEPVSQAAGAVDSAAAAFDRMKALVGTWRVADKPQSPLRIRFSLTAGGTVLVEEWLRGDKPHSLTIYHRDGGSLMAVHYCPQGNQPRLLAKPTNGSKTIEWRFLDAADLDPASESYLVALGFDFGQTRQLRRTETYRAANGDEPSELVLVRDSEPTP